MSLGKKKHSFLSIGFLLLSVIIHGQTGKNYKFRLNGDLQMNHVVSENKNLTVNYSISELNLENISTDTGSFYRISIPGHTPTSEPGKPELPVFCRFISIPEGSDYKIRISEVRTSRIKPSGKKIEGLLFPAQEGEIKEIQRTKPNSRDCIIPGFSGSIGSSG